MSNFVAGHVNPEGHTMTEQPNEQPVTPAEAKNTETAPETPMIPKDRFDQVNTRMKSAEAELARLKASQEKAATEQLKEQERWKELAEQREAELATLRTNMRSATINNAVVAEAAKLGFADPSDAMRMLDASSLSVAEDGSVAGVSDLLKALADSKPYLLAQTQTATPKTPSLNPSNPAGGVALSRESIQNMSPAEVNERWAEIEIYMRENGS